MTRNLSLNIPGQDAWSSFACVVVRFVRRGVLPREHERAVDLFIGAAFDGYFKERGWYVRARRACLPDSGMSYSQPTWWVCQTVRQVRDRYPFVTTSQWYPPPFVHVSKVRKRLAAAVSFKALRARLEEATGHARLETAAECSDAARALPGSCAGAFCLILAGYASR